MHEAESDVHWYPKFGKRHVGLKRKGKEKNPSDVHFAEVKEQQK
jgi:hypothetical protein